MSIGGGTSDLPNRIGNISAIKDIRVVYYDSDIMFAGSEGDCLDFLEGCKEIYPHIIGWKVTTIEEYGSNMWQSGNDAGYGAGYDDGGYLS